MAVQRHVGRALPVVAQEGCNGEDTVQHSVSESTSASRVEIAHPSAPDFTASSQARTPVGQRTCDTPLVNL